MVSKVGLTPSLLFPCSSQALSLFGKELPTGDMPLGETRKILQWVTKWNSVFWPLLVEGGAVCGLCTGLDPRLPLAINQLLQMDFLAVAFWKPDKELEALILFVDSLCEWGPWSSTSLWHLNSRHSILFYSRLCMYARSLFLGSCGTGGLQEEEGIKVVGGRARVGIWSCRSGGNN